MKTFTVCEELFTNTLKLKKYGVLVLNSPNKLVDSNRWEIWNEGKIRVLVDGGSESWMSWMNNRSNEKCKLCLPHLVTGDFDSITPTTLEKIKQIKEVQVIHTPEQDSTDFTKALKEFSRFQKQNNIAIEEIYVMTEIAGRLDHVMANINTLFLAKIFLPDISVFLVCSDSLSWLLEPGSHIIHIPQLLREKKDKCGLIPIGSPAIVTTSGLKWNLSKTKMLFGELVSTSNTYDGSPEVKIETDSNILWTMSTNGFS